MANVKVTDLTAYTDPINTDVLPIVDVTTDTTKKVTFQNLLKTLLAKAGGTMTGTITFAAGQTFPTTGIAAASTSQSGIVQLTDSTSSTSTTTAATPNAVKTTYDLANAALPKAGGTVTGNLEIGTTGSLTFEGSTADAFETAVAVVDPTADRTITFPDATGTVPLLSLAQSFTAAQRGAISALTDGATITPDFALANNFSVTLGGNRTLANPTNLTAGQSGAVFITQDGTGSRTLAFGSCWKFSGGTAPTLTTAASAVDLLVYTVRSTTSIHAQLITNLS